MRERRALAATLHVDMSNTAALALYTGKAGFSQDGVIADYYGNGRDALKLIAELREPPPAVAAFLGPPGSDGRDEVLLPAT